MATVKIVTVALISFASLLISEAKFYKDCGSTANITYAHIGGCTTGACGVKKGKTYNFGIDFVPKYNSTELPTKVSAKIYGVTTTLFKQNACSDLSVPCPITASKMVKYSSQLTVPKSLPSVSGILKVSVKDEKNRQVICGEVKFKIMKHDPLSYLRRCYGPAQESSNQVVSVQHYKDKIDKTHQIIQTKAFEFNEGRIAVCGSQSSPCLYSEKNPSSFAYYCTYGDSEKTLYCLVCFHMLC